MQMHTIRCQNTQTSLFTDSVAHPGLNGWRSWACSCTQQAIALTSNFVERSEALGQICCCVLRALNAHAHQTYGPAIMMADQTVN